MDTDRILASPLARKLAKEHGITISDVVGSGPGGRIIAADIDGVETIPAGTTPFEDVRLSAMRKTIARRMTAAKRTVPHFYLTVDINIDDLLELSRAYNNKHASKCSLNDFIIRASALALSEVPAANVQYAGDTLRQFTQADVSVAVAIKGGLITPIVFDAGAKPVTQIATEMADLVERARTGQLLPEEYQGGTIGISNLGMYGVREFSAVINPPQASILAIGAGEHRPVAIEGQIVAATMMSVTMACDHRAMDGATGAVYLAAFKVLLEDAIRLV